MQSYKYRFSEPFTAFDEKNTPVGLYTEINSVYTHQHSRRENGVFYITCPGAKFICKTPDLKDIEVFAKGNIGFIPNLMSKSTLLRDMNDEYGIIPYPKYDEQQDSYITDIHDAAMMAALPANCGKVDAVCATMESLASLGYRNVIPVYYEIALKTKYNRA